MIDARESGGGSPGAAAALGTGIVALGVAAIVVIPDRWAHAAGLVASVALGVVLCIAGASKLADVDRWRSESSNLGVPAVAASAVPIVELALGALLVVGVGWPVVPVAAGALMTAFTIVVLRELVGGRRPRCACFGAWSNAPMSGRTVVRNSVLVAAAAVALLR